jgi:hypothetical protein
MICAGSAARTKAVLVLPRHPSTFVERPTKKPNVTMSNLTCADFRRPLLAPDAGTRMFCSGIPEKADHAELIAYLKTLH